MATLTIYTTKDPKRSSTFYKGDHLHSKKEMVYSKIELNSKSPRKGKHRDLKKTSFPPIWRHCRKTAAYWWEGICFSRADATFSFSQGGVWREGGWDSLFCTPLLCWGEKRRNLKVHSERDARGEHRMSMSPVRYIHLLVSILTHWGARALPPPPSFSPVCSQLHLVWCILLVYPLACTCPPIFSRMFFPLWSSPCKHDFLFSGDV